MFTNAIAKIYKKSILTYFVFLSIETSTILFQVFFVCRLLLLLLLLLLLFYYYYHHYSFHMAY